MSVFKNRFVVVIACLMWPAPSLAQSTQADRLEQASIYIETALASFDLDLLAAASVEPILESIEVSQPDLYAAKGDRLREIGIATLVRTMRAVARAMQGGIAEHFTLEELRAMNLFYGTEIGRSVLRKGASMSFDLSPSLVETIALRTGDLRARFQAEGVDVDALIEQANE